MRYLRPSSPTATGFRFGLPDPDPEAETGSEFPDPDPGAEFGSGPLATAMPDASLISETRRKIGFVHLDLQTVAESHILVKMRAWWNLSPAASALSNPHMDLTTHFEDLHVYLQYVKETPRI